MNIIHKKLIFYIDVISINIFYLYHNYYRQREIKDTKSKTTHFNMNVVFYKH